MALDLGTSNTQVCLRDRGIVLSVPSFVAVKKGTNQILLDGTLIGESAKKMVDRTPTSIDVIQPLKDGVIADFEMTEALLTYFIQRVHNRKRWISPRLLINVPSGITAVEKRAVFNAAERAGARKVLLVEEPRAAGLGAGLPIHEPQASMIVDIGGGTTDIAVLSLGDVVIGDSLKVAGDAMDAAIIQYLRQSYNILVGANTAEAIKMKIGSACPAGEEEAVVIKGRDLLAGVPRAITITSEEVREALEEPVYRIVEAIRTTLERTGPELSGDLLERGLTLCGGGALLHGLGDVIEDETGLPVSIPEDPLTTVARGTGIFLDYLDEFTAILESAEDDL
jgi:rod shape-determining protein MreB